MNKLETSRDRPDREAILLIAHGSRRQAANNDLRTVAKMMSERKPEAIVEVAYLELTTPTIPEGARACVEAGATSVAMLPFFLSPGVHVVDDLEEFRAGFEQQYPGCQFIVCPPLGVHPQLVEILLSRLDEGRPHSA